MNEKQTGPGSPSSNGRLEPREQQIGLAFKGTINPPVIFVTFSESPKDNTVAFDLHTAERVAHSLLGMVLQVREKQVAFEMAEEQKKNPPLIVPGSNGDSLLKL